MNASTVSTSSGSRGELNGNVDLTITGGTFTENCLIYGGCVSIKKDNSFGGTMTIKGNTTITVNTSSATAEKPIVLCNLVLGSRGWGTIEGDSRLVFTGSGGSNLVINGQLWGSSSGDDLDPTTRIVENPLIEGDRLLSFTGFYGELVCKKISGFKSIEFKSLTQTNSSVELDHEDEKYGVYDLSDVENWTFENGSTLAGNFKNDFSGDTLNLNGFLSAVSGVTLITDLNSGDGYDAFNGLANLSKVFLNGNDVGTLTKTWTDGTETQLKSLSWSAGSSGNASWFAGSLDLNANSNGGMVMKLSLVGSSTN